MFQNILYKDPLLLKWVKNRINICPIFFYFLHKNQLCGYIGCACYLEGAKLTKSQWNKGLKSTNGQFLAQDFIKQKIIQCNYSLLTNLSN